MQGEILKKKKEKKICFAQHCVLIADKGNHHLLQTVAPPNQGVCHQRARAGTHTCCL